MSDWLKDAGHLTLCVVSIQVKLENEQQVQLCKSTETHGVIVSSYIGIIFEKKDIGVRLTAVGRIMTEAY